MKVEDCIVTVERRTVGGCIDLAFVFARYFAGPLLKLTLCFAVPSVLLSWLAANAMRHDVIFPCLLIFGFSLTLMSGAMIATVGPQVFGVPLTTGAATRGLWRRLLPYAFLGLLSRMTGFCVGIPIFFVLAWCGHLPEVMFLERTALNSVPQRLSQLCRASGYSRNLGRLITITAFWVIFAFGLFLLIDVLSGLIFNAPIFFGTIAPGPDQRAAFASRIIDDPLVVTTLQAALWITYPIARLAWFFCYLDQRIRNECWDLELQFRVESARLGDQIA